MSAGEGVVNGKLHNIYLQAFISANTIDASTAVCRASGLNILTRPRYVFTYALAIRREQSQTVATPQNTTALSCNDGVNRKILDFILKYANVFTYIFVHSSVQSFIYHILFLCFP